MKLEKFTGQGRKVNRHISITKSSSFGIPPTFYKENDINTKSYVDVYYDKEEGVIGLVFKDNNEDGGFKIQKYGKEDSIGANIIARSFFKTYKFDQGEIKGRYMPEKIVDPKIGIIYLLHI